MPSNFKSAMRAAAFRCAPRLANTYRQWRDRHATSAQAVETPFGFKFAGNAAMASGNFEKNEIGVFLRYLQRVSVCVDIGANIGLYTCLAASHAKHVIAIEPLVTNLELLYRNISINQFEEVEVFPVGLADRSGVSKLFGTGTGASLVAGWADSLKDSFNMIAVSTLDRLLNLRFEGSPLLIKMDVEGFELAVLKGAERTLKHQPRPLWLVEICLDQNFPGGSNKSFSETFEIFWRNGYQARIADDEERLVEEADVARWVRQGHTDFGSHNYVFR